MRDRRDLREPQEFGETYLELRKSGVPKRVAVLHEAPEYSPAPVDHSESYRKELEQRAAEGDKYARSMLETGEPLD